MHLFMSLSGAQQVIELLKQQLNSQAWPASRVHGVTGKREEYFVQGVWRPIEFGHYVFPEEHLNTVLDMLSINPNPKPGQSKFEGVPGLDIYKNILRKVLRLEKLPEEVKVPEKGEKRIIFLHQHANIIPIGIKKDGRGLRKFEDGVIYEQEWL